LKNFISTFRFRLLVAIGIAIGIVILVPVVSKRLDRNAASDRVAAAVAEEVAKIKVVHPPGETTLHIAMRARNAIMENDYATARKISLDVMRSSKVTDWTFYPFSAFIKQFSDAGASIFEKQLNKWVESDKNDAISFLVRAQYRYDVGWLRRGSKFIREIRSDHVGEFELYMESGLSDINESIRLDDNNPYAYLLRLRIMQGTGNGESVTTAFNESISKYPMYYPLYEQYLDIIQPKWGGSIKSMYDFVNKYAGNSEKHSPLKLLYLALYEKLLNYSYFSCDYVPGQSKEHASCLESQMEKVVSATLQNEISNALEVYDYTDKYNFGILAKKIGLEMINTPDAEVYSEIILQQMAEHMHSDAEMTEENPGKNDYIIDQLSAQSWYRRGFYQSALKKNVESIQDMENTAFPDSDSKNSTIASAYEYGALIYSALNDSVEMIASIKVAKMLVGDSRNEQYICRGYYQLKIYDDAIQECTDIISRYPQNFETRYWRGMVYREMGNVDSALQDMVIVAESEDSRRSWAAIEMALMYFNRGDFLSEIDILNKYKYLFDPKETSDMNVAVSYHDRCYAYMKLNKLEMALADCRMSLKYANLPDAYIKQQEIIKRLGK
jgi:tetratricopeptide (TPR) repeat protein